MTTLHFGPAKDHIDHILPGVPPIQIPVIQNSLTFFSDSRNRTQAFFHLHGVHHACRWSIPQTFRHFLVSLLFSLFFACPFFKNCAFPIASPRETLSQSAPIAASPREVQSAESHGLIGGVKFDSLNDNSSPQSLVNNETCAQLRFDLVRRQLLEIFKATQKFKKIFKY